MVRNAEYSKKRYFFLKKTLKITNRGVYYLKSIWAPVAQLDRASASGVEGHEFESRRVYHSLLFVELILLRGIIRNVPSPLSITFWMFA